MSERIPPIEEQKQQIKQWFFDYAEAKNQYEKVQESDKLKKLQEDVLALEIKLTVDKKKKNLKPSERNSIKNKIKKLQKDMDNWGKAEKRRIEKLEKQKESLKKQIIDLELKSPQEIFNESENSLAYEQLKQVFEDLFPQLAEKSKAKKNPRSNEEIADQIVRAVGINPALEIAQEDELFKRDLTEFVDLLDERKDYAGIENTPEIEKRRQEINDRLAKITSDDSFKNKVKAMTMEQAEKLFNQEDDQEVLTRLKNFITADKRKKIPVARLLTETDRQNLTKREDGQGSPTVEEKDAKRLEKLGANFVEYATLVLEEKKIKAELKKLPRKNLSDDQETLKDDLTKKLKGVQKILNKIDDYRLEKEFLAMKPEDALKLVDETKYPDAYKYLQEKLNEAKLKQDDDEPMEVDPNQIIEETDIDPIYEAYNDDQKYIYNFIELTTQKNDLQGEIENLQRELSSSSLTAVQIEAKQKVINNLKEEFKKFSEKLQRDFSEKKVIAKIKKQGNFFDPNTSPVLNQTLQSLIDAIMEDEKNDKEKVAKDKIRKKFISYSNLVLDQALKVEEIEVAKKALKARGLTPEEITNQKEALKKLQEELQKIDNKLSHVDSWKLKDEIEALNLTDASELIDEKKYPESFNYLKTKLQEMKAEKNKEVDNTVEEKPQDRLETIYQEVKDSLDNGGSRDLRVVAKAFNLSEDEAGLLLEKYYKEKQNTDKEKNNIQKLLKALRSMTKVEKNAQEIKALAMMYELTEKKVQELIDLVIAEKPKKEEPTVVIDPKYQEEIEAQKRQEQDQKIIDEWEKSHVKIEEKMTENKTSIQDINKELAVLEVKFYKKFSGLSGFLHRTFYKPEYLEKKQALEQKQKEFQVARAEFVAENIEMWADKQLELIEAKAEVYNNNKNWSGKFMEIWRKNTKLRLVASAAMLGVGAGLAWTGLGAGIAAAGVFALRRAVGTVGSYVGSYNMLRASFSGDNQIKLSKEDEAVLKTYAKKNKLGFFKKNKDDGYLDLKKQLIENSVKKLPDEKFDDYISSYESRLLLDGLNPKDDPAYVSLINERHRRLKVQMKDALGEEKPDLNSLYGKKIAEKIQEMVSEQSNAFFSGLKYLYLAKVKYQQLFDTLKGTSKEKQSSEEFKKLQQFRKKSAEQISKLSGEFKKYYSSDLSILKVQDLAKKVLNENDYKTLAKLKVSEINDEELLAQDLSVNEVFSDEVMNVFKSDKELIRHAQLSAIEELQKEAQEWEKEQQEKKEKTQKFFAHLDEQMRITDALIDEKKKKEKTKRQVMAVVSAGIATVVGSGVIFEYLRGSNVSAKELGNVIQQPTGAKNVVGAVTQQQIAQQIYETPSNMSIPKVSETIAGIQTINKGEGVLNAVNRLVSENDTLKSMSKEALHKWKVEQLQKMGWQFKGSQWGTDITVHPGAKVNLMEVVQPNGTVKLELGLGDQNISHHGVSWRNVLPAEDLQKLAKPDKAMQIITENIQNMKDKASAINLMEEALNMKPSASVYVEPTAFDLSNLSPEQIQSIINEQAHLSMDQDLYGEKLQAMLQQPSPASVTAPSIVEELTASLEPNDLIEKQELSFDLGKIQDGSVELIQQPNGSIALNVNGNLDNITTEDLIKAKILNANWQDEVNNSLTNAEGQLLGKNALETQTLENAKRLYLEQMAYSVADSSKSVEIKEALKQMIADQKFIMKKSETRLGDVFTI